MSINYEYIITKFFSIDNINKYYIIDDDIICENYIITTDNNKHIDYIYRIISKDIAIITKIKNIINIFNKVVMNEDNNMYYDIDNKIMINIINKKKYINNKYRVICDKNDVYEQFIKYYEIYLNSIRNINKYINYDIYSKIKNKKDNIYYYIEYDKYIDITDNSLYKVSYYKSNIYNYITTNKYIDDYYDKILYNDKNIDNIINNNGNSYYDLYYKIFINDITNKKYINHDIKICCDINIIYTIFMNEYNIKSNISNNLSNVIKNDKNNITRKKLGKNIKNIIFDRDGGKCFCCSVNLIKEPKHDNSYEVGHIKPHCQGGDTDINNLKSLCFNCNRGMSSMHMYEYMITNNLNVFNIPINIEYCLIFGFVNLKNKIISILDNKYKKEEINKNIYDDINNKLNNSRYTIEERLNMINDFNISLNLNLYEKQYRYV